MKYTPHPYGEFARQHILKNPAAGLFLDMGLGKTVITLTALNDMLFDYCTAKKVLVIAPLRVADWTWTAEAAKWDHLRHLKFSKVLGTQPERLAALRARADIYLINRDQVSWLCGHYGTKWPFDTVVLDESSSFKSPKSNRFRDMKVVRPFIKRIIALTGTPSPNGLVDLWSQMYLLDQGQRLGKTITRYTERFFTANPYSRRLTMHPGAESLIHAQIGDICFSMRKEDYLQLPPLVTTVRKAHMSEEEMEGYERFEQESVIRYLDSLAAGEMITAVNAAVLTGKLLQYANGALYDKDKKVHRVHSAKLDELEEIIEEANGNPVLVGYSFQFDVDMIMSRFPNAVLFKSGKEGAAQLKDWNDKKIPILLAHPDSVAYGLNMQDGGNIVVLYGLTWSLEKYQQFIARLHRQGQTKPTYLFLIVTHATMDEEVCKAITAKTIGQDRLLAAVKAVESLIHKYAKNVNE
jgi:SNF2 family DNA or RNA helicase